MAELTGSLLAIALSILSAIFLGTYLYFLWSFQKWKRNNVPYFEPSFPNGNRSPISKGVQFGEEIFNITVEAKKKG